MIVDPARYGCGSWQYRGASVCANTIKVSRTVAEAIILESLQKDLFTHEALALFKQETTRLLTQRRRDAAPEVAVTRARLVEVDRQIAHILAAVKKGFRSDRLKHDLQEAEHERARLRVDLARQTSQLDNLSAFLPNVAERFATLVHDLPRALEGRLEEARNILRDLIGPQIPVRPTVVGKERYLTAELSANYAGFLGLVAGQNKCGGGQGIWPWLVHSLRHEVRGAAVLG